MLDFRIKTFLCVCKYLNYTKAAEELHITQPAVSQQIHYLEDLYQVQLFMKEGRKIQLTSAGQMLYQSARTANNNEFILMKQLRFAKEELPLSFGITMTIGEFVISDPLAHYFQKHPQTNLQLILSNTSDLINRLREGSLHFALIEGNFNTKEFDSLLFTTEPFIPVCSMEHTFIEENISLSDLFSEHLFLREPGSGTRNILENYLTLENYSIDNFAKITEIGNMHIILEMVKRDLGITFLYQSAASQELLQHSLKTIPLKHFNITHDFTFIWAKQSLLSDNYHQICNE